MQIAADSFEIAAADATDPADLIRFEYRWFSTLEEAVRRYPEDPEVWYRLGDARFHSDPPFGGSPTPALEAFDHAIALDPGFAPAYEHDTSWKGGGGIRIGLRIGGADQPLRIEEFRSGDRGGGPRAHDIPDDRGGR